MKEEKKIDRNSSSSKMNNFLTKIIFIIFDVIRCNKETIIPNRRRDEFARKNVKFHDPGAYAVSGMKYTKMAATCSA